MPNISWALIWPVIAVVYLGLRRRSDTTATPVVAIAVACTFAVLTVMAFSIIDANERADAGQQQIERLGRCLLEEMTAHRQASQADRLAEGTVLPPNIPPPPDPSNHGICNEFINQPRR